MFGNNYKKNSKRLLEICEHYIEEYEKNSPKSFLSCKEDMLHSIRLQIEAEKADVAKWKDYDTNYIEIAHSMLAHTSFDLLASGRYHLYYGILNPMRCTSTLMAVYDGAMEWGVKNGLIDNDTKKEQHDYLIKCISEVG
jgi:hypothetical protein